MTANSISRGFHRLAIFIATVPLIVGCVIAIVSATDIANREHARHQDILCARERWKPPPEPYNKPGATDEELIAEINHLAGVVNLKVIGCFSGSGSENITYEEMRNKPNEVSWLIKLILPFAFFAAISAVVALVVYGVVRAIGWVISGFA